MSISDFVYRRFETLVRPLDIPYAPLPSSGPFARVSPEEWRAAMATNLDGVYNCCSAAIGAMRAAGHGRIVTIASTAGLQGFSYTAPYVAAKHGAVGLMRDRRLGGRTDTFRAHRRSG